MGALWHHLPFHLPAKVDLSDVAGEVSPSVVPQEENKTTLQTEEGCPLVKTLSM